MSFILQPWQVLLLALAGWINREQQEVIEYLRTENQIPRESHGKKRIKLNDNQRRRLAIKGHPQDFPCLCPGFPPSCPARDIRGSVSTSRHVARSMRISRTTRSYRLLTKGYGTWQRAETLDASLTSAGLANAVSTDHRSPRPTSKSTFRGLRGSQVAIGRTYVLQLSNAPECKMAAQQGTICLVDREQYVAIVGCNMSGERITSNTGISRYIERHVERALADALKDTPVVCILGPRQCGKSTLALRQAPGRTYLSLDDQSVL